MAIHNSISSMLQESLHEMLLVSKYCIEYRKNPKIWGCYGCYGYPAAILLLAITDAIGSHVIGGSCVRKHFDILKDYRYYNLALTKRQIDDIYKEYRCLLTHNAILGANAFLGIGSQESPILEYKDQKTYINLFPFFLLTNRVVARFLKKEKVK